MALRTFEHLKSADDHSFCWFCTDDSCELGWMEHEGKQKAVCRECFDELKFGIISPTTVHFIGNGRPSEHKSDINYHGFGSTETLGRKRKDA